MRQGNRGGKKVTCTAHNIDGERAPNEQRSPPSPFAHTNTTLKETHTRSSSTSFERHLPAGTGCGTCACRSSSARGTCGACDAGRGYGAPTEAWRAGARCAYPSSYQCLCQQQCGQRGERSPSYPWEGSTETEKPRPPPCDCHREHQALPHSRHHSQPAQSATSK